MGKTKKVLIAVAAGAVFTVGSMAKESGAAHDAEDVVVAGEMREQVKGSEALLNLGSLADGGCVVLEIPGLRLSDAEQRALNSRGGDGAPDVWNIASLDEVARTTLPRNQKDRGIVRLALGVPEGSGPVPKSVTVDACGAEYSGFNIDFPDGLDDNVLLVYPAEQPTPSPTPGQQAG